ncbi:M1 family metallopeptidase [Sphingomonas flavalba]|uniref:M1 family metallopeptidase n=1 Tax=Sphingomonas flavalba TaxID=2559804 RepID=UPI00109E12A2|nr:M1 family metallopeptidase [Sphingomonas flavalba]
MKPVAYRTLVAGAALLVATAAVAQTTAAAPDPDAEAKFITPQTRKMGGVMPPEQLALSFEHLDLALKVFPDEKRIEGDATLTLRAKEAVPELILDLYPKFRIASIVLNGRTVSPADYTNTEGQLRIKLRRPLAKGSVTKARIVWSGTPPLAKRPPWEGGTTWTKTPDGQTWIDTSHWGGGCDLLYPCIDHPTGKTKLADLHYTVPAPLVAPGNGTFMGMTEKDGWRTYNWRARSPHTYGLVLDVGPYKLLEGDYKSRFGNTIPMRFWYLPGEEEKAAELFKEFPVALDFFESQIGPYPWGDQKMGVIRVPYSGLENQTLNGYSIDYTKTMYGFDPLMHHEFSHEWFANQLSVANYDDLWLHEGIGSYMQPLLGRYLYGDLDYHALLKSQRAGIRNEKPLVSGEERPENWVYADPTGPRGDIYPKGSWVMHTLRNLIGDEAFYEVIRRVTYGRPDPRPGNFEPQFGTSKGFMATVNQVTGSNYDWFFNIYLYRAGLPKLVETRAGDRLSLRWETPDNLPFPMPVDVRVDGRTVTLAMADGTGVVDAPASATVTLDPEAKILRQLDSIDQFQAWRATQPDQGRRR